MWLKTHWISRPTVTTWSSGQTGRSNQRCTPVIGEARKASSPARPGIRAASSLGMQPADPIEGDGQDHEVRGDPLTRAERTTPLAIGLDAADARRQPDLDVVRAEPGFEPGAVELAQRDERDLHLESVAVAEEAVEEHLARVADVHLLEPLVQGRDEHRRPVEVHRPGRLAVAEQPVGERLARHSPRAGVRRSRARP